MIAVTVTAIAFGGYSMTSVQSDAFSSVDESGFLSGHVTVEVKDSEGNLKAYSQSDNKIVGRGLEILAKNTFNMGASGNVTGSEGAAEYIQVGNDGENTAVISHTVLSGAITNCTPVLATKAITGTGWTNNAGAAQLAVRLTATIADTDCADSSLDEVGLFDGSTGSGTDEMFAKNTFSTVNYQSGDSLAITWDITLDGN